MTSEMNHASAHVPQLQLKSVKQIKWSVWRKQQVWEPVSWPPPWFRCTQPPLWLWWPWCLPGVGARGCLTWSSRKQAICPANSVQSVLEGWEVPSREALGVCICKPGSRFLNISVGSDLIWFWWLGFHEDVLLSLQEASSVLKLQVAEIENMYM